MKIVVTGGSGRAGQVIVPDLLAHGHHVTTADFKRGPDQGAHFMSTEMTDLGQVVTATRGAEAIIHMAAIAQVYPDVPVNKPIEGFATAIDNSKAKAMLGWSHPATWPR